MTTDSVRPVEAQRTTAKTAAATPPLLGEVLVELGMVQPEEPLLTAHEQDLGDPRKLGEILVAAGKLTDEQLELALVVQKAHGAPAADGKTAAVRERLGELLDRLDYVPLNESVKRLHRQESGDPRQLGELLIADGLLTRAQLADALEVQQHGRLSMPLVPAAASELPEPPTDTEKWSYAKRGRWLVPIQVVSFAAAGFSLVRFSLMSWALLPFLATFFFTVVYFALGQVSSWSGRGRFDANAHERRARNWNPVSYPSVDVFLPNCGEDLTILENTWQNVARLQYPGTVTVYCLDDAARPEVAELARRYRFEYLARPTHEFKKAGNLRYAYDRSGGEFVVIFDADFVPRPDFLTELLPYMDDPSVGIVQSPQFFDVSRAQNWLQRGAGAVQELFYRHIQPGRSAAGAPICVGSNAVYRRSALHQVGGTALIEHSEDVHTGFSLLAAGYRTKYIPLPLAKGLCPDRLSAFFNQQYRWCSGSMSLLRSRKFWSTKLSLRQRASFVSGFAYYLHTALWTFLAPLPAIVMVLCFPRLVALQNYIPLLPSVVVTWLLFPAWHKGRYPRGAATRVRAIYGYAHLFAAIDAVTGRTHEWSVTGGATQRRGRYVPFRQLHRIWGSTVALTLLGGAAWRIHQGMDALAFAPLIAFGALNGYQTIRIAAMARAATRRPRVNGRHRRDLAPSVTTLDVRRLPSVDLVRLRTMVDAEMEFRVDSRTVTAPS